MAGRDQLGPVGARGARGSLPETTLRGGAHGVRGFGAVQGRGVGATVTAPLWA